MTQIRLEFIYNGSFPVDVFISDIYGNNSSQLGTIDPGPVPPQVMYNTVIPSIFNTAPQVMLTLRDNDGCEVFKILDCTFNCALEIIITPNFVYT
jgi:hypothetical protein